MDDDLKIVIGVGVYTILLSLIFTQFPDYFGTHPYASWAHGPVFIGH